MVKATHYICKLCRRMVPTSDAVLFLEVDWVVCSRCYREQYRTEVVEGLGLAGNQGPCEADWLAAGQGVHD